MQFFKYIETKNNIDLYQIIEGDKTYIQSFTGEHAKELMLEYIETNSEIAILIIED